MYDVCIDKYNHFEEDFDMLLSTLWENYRELEWIGDEFKIVNTFMLRNLAIQKTKEKLTTINNFSEKYPEIKPFCYYLMKEYLDLL